LARCCDKAYGLDQGPDRGLAPLDQLAQDHQAPLVGERPQDIGNMRGIGREDRQIGGCFGHRVLSLSKVLLI
jgi:hypothetical protein